MLPYEVDEPLSREVDMTTAALLENRPTERKRQTIACSRCGGFMIVERSFDSIDGAARIDVSVRRCVQCGEVVDSVILQNRRTQIGNDLSPPQRGDKIS